MVRHIPCGAFVNDSERRAVERLKAKLQSASGNWVLLSNLNHAQHSGRRADEIDIVAIGPPGVSTIEVKHWDSAYLRRQGPTVDTEADRIDAKAKRIAGTLRPRLDPGFVAGKLLLTKGTGRFDRGRRPSPRGANVFGLSEWRELLDSFQEAEGYPGELHFFSLVDPAAPSLTDRRTDNAWSPDARLDYARAAVAALRELHHPQDGADAQPTLHRQITPRSLRVRHNNRPLFTELNLTRLGDAVTLAPATTDFGDLAPFYAPRCAKAVLRLPILTRTCTACVAPCVYCSRRMTRCRAR